MNHMLDRWKVIEWPRELEALALNLVNSQPPQ